MNPNVYERRGCFIRKEENGKFTVVDYPTWTFNKYGMFTQNQNRPLREGEAFEKTFDAEADALKFCAEENYLVCRSPYGKKVENESFE